MALEFGCEDSSSVTDEVLWHSPERHDFLVEQRCESWRVDVFRAGNVERILGEQVDDDHDRVIDLPLPFRRWQSRDKIHT